MLCRRGHTGAMASAATASRTVTTPRAHLTPPLRQMGQRLLSTVRRLGQQRRQLPPAGPKHEGLKTTSVSPKSPCQQREAARQRLVSHPLPPRAPRIARAATHWHGGWIARFHGFRGWPAWWGSKLRSVLQEPAGMILLPAYTLYTAAAVAGFPGSLWLPVLSGTVLGGAFAFLNRWCNVRLWLRPRAPLSVVITGGSRGLGKALARELLREGDRVLITSRTPDGLSAAIRELRVEVGGGTMAATGTAAGGTMAAGGTASGKVAGGAQLFGAVVDVADPASVAQLPAEALRRLGGRVDVWVNNAAVSGSFQALGEQSDEALAAVVTTNLLGGLLCARQAARLLASQPGGGHIFIMDGAGADGLATPNYAAYGSTKAGLAHLSESLAEELEGTAVRVHTLSPGMIITDLLLDGATQRNKQVFNILCEHPETVAAFLVPRIKSVVARGETGAYVRFLTPASALWRFATAPWRFNRFFDADGTAIYPNEHDRILGPFVKATERAAAWARRRNQTLQLAYSFSLVFSVGVVLLLADATGGAALAGQ